MHHAVDVCPLGELADPRTVVRLAVAAERAGWDGLSIWDSLGTSMGAAAGDPLVTLAAVASATTRLRLITSVLALPRRRPQLVAQSVATLDRLSGGRVTLGLGSGGDPGDLEPFGEPVDPAARAQMLDEGAALVDNLLRGETVDHVGPTYRAAGVAVGPRPLQQPRPPIWIGGMSTAALRRAARWDGWIAIGVSDDGAAMNLAPARLGVMVAQISDRRAALGRAGEPLDVAVFGLSEPGDGRLVAEFGAAGASWWLESLSPLRGPIDQLLQRIEAGPPIGG